MAYFHSPSPVSFKFSPVLATSLAPNSGRENHVAGGQHADEEKGDGRTEKEEEGI